MKLKVNKNDLLKGLAYCASIIPPKVLIQSLECVFLNIKNKEITMRTTSMSTEVVFKIDIAEDIELDCLIPCNLFLNAIRLIREEYIQLTFKKKEENSDFVVEIKSKKGKSKIQSQDYRGFPKSKLENANFKEYITFKNNEGINQIKSALDFVKVEDLRPSLSCVRFTVRKEKMTVVGMNGIAGANINTKIHNSFNMDLEFAISKNVLDNMFKTNPIATSYFYINENMFMIKNANLLFIGDNYTELKYPKIDHLFSNKGDSEVVINPREVKDSISRVVNFSETGDNGFRLVGFNLEDDYSNCVILSENYSGSSEETNEVISKDVNSSKKEDNTLRTKLNSIYLSKILESTDKNVTMNFFDIDGVYNKAIHISVPGESAEEEYEKQFIIMPSI